MEEKSKENSNFPLFAWAKKRKEIGGGKLVRPKSFLSRPTKFFPPNSAKGEKEGIKVKDLLPSNFTGFFFFDIDISALSFYIFTLI